MKLFVFLLIMRDELIKGTKSRSPFAGEFKIGNFPVECEIRGIVNRVHKGDEVQKNNKVIDSCFYLEVNFYRVNKDNYKAFIGTVKVYIPTNAMGLRDVNSSVFYYPSTDPKNATLFQTAKKDLNGLLHKRVGIVGKMKDSPQDQYTHFMNAVKKVVIFLTPEELNGKKG